MGKTLDLTTRKQLAEQGRKSFYFFAKAILGFDWLTPHVHLPLSKKLENLEKSKRALVILPRGWLKTTECSIAYPIWRAVRNPEVRVLVTQNTHTNACGKLRVIKGIFDKNILFRTLYPEILPTKDCIWKEEALCINRPKDYAETTFEAAGTGTQATSRHYNLIIEDDTVAPDIEDAGSKHVIPSPDDIEHAIGWHRVAYSLLNDQATDQRLVVGTRWAERDLLSWIKDNEDYDVYERAVREGPDGLADEHGEIVYPERFGEAALEMIRKDHGPYMYRCLYLNNPTRSEDMLFKPEWIKYYEEPPRDLLCWTTVDLAGDPASVKGDNPDYNAVMTCGKDLARGNVYVLAYNRGRVNPGKVIDWIFSHVERFSPVQVGIEAIQYQSTLAYWVRERMNKQKKHFLVKTFTHGKRSKESRIFGLQPLVASGALMFRSWMVDLVGELLAFPLGAHDDLADVLASQKDLWAMTSSVKEGKEKSDDPWVLAGALKELRERNEPKDGFPFDMYRDKRFSSAGRV